MNSPTNFVRINVSMPSDLARELGEKLPPRGRSKFLSDAAKEKMHREERIKAFKELLAMPPAFTFLKGRNAAAKWVRESRREDEKRLKRIWGNNV